MENIRQVCKELGRKWVQRFLDRKVYLLLSSAFGFFGAWKIVWIMVTFLMSSTKMVQLLFLAGQGNDTGSDSSGRTKLF